MSSTPHSPPGTPSKQAMTIGKENVKSRAPLLEEAIKKSESQMNRETLEFIEKPGYEIQVPGTAPIGKIESLEKSEELSAQKPAEAEDEDISSDTNDDPDAELPPFDWEEFRDRYTEEINVVNHEEDAIMKQFDVITQVKY
jgi:hypothetical protein